MIAISPNYNKYAFLCKIDNAYFLHMALFNYVKDDKEE
jgi:hypothetical protein